jgi:4,5-epoxidase
LKPTTVLIAGAGPTGLALACDLRLHGVDAQVVDKFDQPPTTTRALGVQPRGRQILDRLGVLGDLARTALPQTSFDVYVDGKLAVRVDLGSLQGPDDDGPLRVPQTAIEDRLRRRLQGLGASVEWRREVIGACQDGSGVDVSVRSQDGEQTVRCQWLIGCDGAHSACRRIAGAQFDGAAFPETFLLGDVRLSGARKDNAVIYLRRGQMLSMASLPDGAWRIGVALPPGDPLAEKGGEGLTADRSKSTTSMGEGLQRLQELFAAYSGDTETRLSEPTWFSIFRIHRRMASTFRAGRIVLCGDAAHLTSPLGGQGLNTGLSDAFNLGWKLALVVQGRADDSLIDTYEAERRPATQKVDRATAAWTGVLLGEGSANRFLRRWVALPAMRLRPMQAWVLTRRGSLQSSYRGGPLARGARTGVFSRLMHPGPQAGDGAPDAQCRRLPDGTPTSVGRELGPNWGLIVFGPATEAARRCVRAARMRVGVGLRVLRLASHGDKPVFGETLAQDERGAVERAYKPRRDTVLLLRPDGQVAWRSSSEDSRGLEAWLDAVLLVQPKFEPATPCAPPPQV